MCIQKLIFSQCLMTACGMISFGGLLSEYLPCLIVFSVIFCATDNYIKNIRKLSSWWEGQFWWGIVTHFSVSFHVCNILKLYLPYTSYWKKRKHSWCSVMHKSRRAETTVHRPQLCLTSALLHTRLENSTWFERKYYHFCFGKYYMSWKETTM